MTSTDRGKGSARCTCDDGSAEEDRGAVLACSVHGIGRPRVEPGSDAHMERLAIRMLYKVCPLKETHSHKTGEWNVESEHCPQCGIDRSDFDRFIMGEEGKPNA